MHNKQARIVKYEIDPLHPPALSSKQRRELAALAKMSGKDIDYSDIPPIPTTMLLKAVRGGIHRRRASPSSAGPETSGSTTRKQLGPTARMRLECTLEVANGWHHGEND
jgi:hypothetical protein